MTDCKLNTNFATVFNKLKLNNINKINHLPKNAHFEYKDKFGRKIYTTANNRYTVIDKGLYKGVYSERYKKY